MGLIVRVNMFTATQTAYITGDNGDIEKTLTVNTESIDEDILTICKEENINSVIISGPMMYTKGFEKRIKQAELTKYNTNTLNITLIK